MKGKCLDHQVLVKDGGGHLAQISWCQVVTAWQDGRREALCSTGGIIRDNFQLLKEHLNKGGCLERPQDIYNCDESIVDLNKCTQRAVIPKRVKRAAHTRDAASTEHLSIHWCVSAAGRAMPPFMIFKNSLPGGNYAKDGPDGCLRGKQESGFMDCDLFTWFQQLFIPHVCPTAERPVLLLLEGHISHCSPQVIELVCKNYVTLFALAPNTTHICQPLDVAVHKIFKSKLR